MESVRPGGADEDLAFLAFAFHLYDQVNGKLTIAGVNCAHCTGDFVYTNLVCTSYWHVKLDGLKFNGAAVKTTGAAEPTMDMKFMAYASVTRRCCSSQVFCPRVPPDFFSEHHGMRRLYPQEFVRRPTAPTCSKRLMSA